MNEMDAAPTTKLKVLAAGSQTLEQAADLLADMDAMATRHRTPCGEGDMVWRRWGDGPPVVLLHGGGGAWSHWVRNIGVLAERHSVWAADLPGLGDSASPSRFTVEDVAAPVAAGLQTLLGKTPFDLISFSFGGPIACYVASREGLRVRNLVLTAARFVLEEGHSFPSLVKWKGLQDEAERMAAHWRNLHLMMIADSVNIDALALQIQATNTPRARFYGPQLKPGEKLHQYLPQVKLSGRITGISGAEDQVAKAIMGEQEAALRAIHPSARFHAIKGAGHWVQYEAAEAYNPLLLEALGG